MQKWLNLWGRRIKWALRLWPIYLFIGFIVLHMYLVYPIPEYSDLLDLIWITILQLFGGYFILKAINDNLNIFSGSSLNQIFLNYLKSFPKKPVNANLLEFRDG